MNNIEFMIVGTANRSILAKYANYHRRRLVRIREAGFILEGQRGVKQPCADEWGVLYAIDGVIRSRKGLAPAVYRKPLTGKNRAIVDHNGEIKP